MHPKAQLKFKSSKEATIAKFHSQNFQFPIKRQHSESQF